MPTSRDEGLGPNATPFQVPAQGAQGPDAGFRRIRLPEASRDAQLDRWGIGPQCVGAATHTPEGEDFLAEGGWGILDPDRGRPGGTRAHRGVLHPGEYVDTKELQKAVAARLGFTVEEIRSVYRQGPLSPQARELRTRIDARFLEVSESGGNVVELCRALGFPIREREGDCQAAKAALRRARELKDAA